MTGDASQGTRRMFADIDVSKPNIARVYDALLGGKDNFAADREFVAKVLEQAPKAPLWAKGNRAFLRRVVRHLVNNAGITQFLDIGSGLPTQGNVSEVAHDIDPTVHVVHVDNDPVVFTHSKALLTDAYTTDIVLGDIRDPAGILADPGIRALIDFDRPVGLLLFAILHHIEDQEDPGWIAAQLRDAMPSGSYLAISSFRMPGPEAAELRAATIEGERLLAGHLGSGRWREDEEILAWFGDWELLEPGLVAMPDWRPPVRGRIRHDEVYHSSLCGVARKKALLPDLLRQGLVMDPGFVVYKRAEMPDRPGKLHASSHSGRGSGASRGRKGPCGRKGPGNRRPIFRKALFFHVIQRAQVRITVISRQIRGRSRHAANQTSLKHSHRAPDQPQNPNPAQFHNR